MAAHALLGPSSAHRWLLCTPSARLEETYPDTSSPFAEEGTLAHAVAEAVLTDTYPLPEHDDDMAGHVLTYVDYVLSRPGDLHVEERLDFSEWVPEGFGTGDAIVIADGTMEVIDLKYGKGVKVSAKDNPQLRLYALGAYAKYKPLYHIDDVKMTIVQPRAGGVSSDTISVTDLLAWAESIKPTAQLAWEGKGDFNPGHRQCRFCKAQNDCKARAMQKQAIAAQRHNKLGEAEVAALLPELDDVIKWAKGLQKHALKQARDNGVVYPGYSLRPGTSRRKYTDTAAKALEDAGFTDIYKDPDLLNLGDMEKLIGKDLLDEITYKPPAKLTLAPTENPFKEEIENDN